MGSDHPESPSRLVAIQKLLETEEWNQKLLRKEANKIDLTSLCKLHPKHHVEALMEQSPSDGIVPVAADVCFNPHTIDASLYAAGAAIQATDEVIAGVAKNAFCPVRPPGHHAETAISMGFCVFNSVALAAERALASGMERVAILDFDVHHGNGTVEIFQDRPEVLVCSSFQYPFYPGRFDEVVRPNIFLTPFQAHTDSSVFRQTLEPQWREALHQHQPEMIFISAGFDAHAHDPLAQLDLVDEDYLWLTQFILNMAGEFSEDRVVSMLEGGYDINALTRCVKLHIDGLSAA